MANFGLSKESSKFGFGVGLTTDPQSFGLSQEEGDCLQYSKILIAMNVIPEGTTQGSQAWNRVMQNNGLNPPPQGIRIPKSQGGGLLFGWINVTKSTVCEQKKPGSISPIYSWTCAGGRPEEECPVGMFSRKNEDGSTTMVIEAELCKRLSHCIMNQHGIKLGSVPNNKKECNCSNKRAITPEARPGERTRVGGEEWMSQIAGELLQSLYANFQTIQNNLFGKYNESLINKKEYLSESEKVIVKAFENWPNEFMWGHNGALLLGGGQPTNGPGGRGLFGDDTVCQNMQAAAAAAGCPTLNKYNCCAQGLFH